MNQAYDFPVTLQDVFTKSGAQIPNTKSIVRFDTGTPLSVVSDRYHLFTHKEAVEATEPFLKYFGESKTTQYLERNGTRFVMEHTFPNRSVQVSDKKVGDVVNFRLSIVNSYDGTSSLTVKVGAMVLRCLNGMTLPEGDISLGFRHVGSIRNLELPDPTVITTMFDKANEEWNAWGARDVTDSDQDFIVTQAMRMQVITQRTLDKHEEKLKPILSREGQTMWSYYNNFTNVLTHHLPRVQHTRKLVRFDKLNSIFRTAVAGKTEVASVH